MTRLLKLSLIAFLALAGIQMTATEVNAQGGRSCDSFDQEGCCACALVGWWVECVDHAVIGGTFCQVYYIDECYEIGLCIYYGAATPVSPDGSIYAFSGARDRVPHDAPGMLGISMPRPDVEWGVTCDGVIAHRIYKGRAALAVRERLERIGL